MLESLMKYVVICVLGMVLVSLSVAFRRIAMSNRSGEDSRAAVRALSIRVALSFGLVALLLAASGLGWLRPHGLTPATPATPAISGAPVPGALQSQ